MAIKDITHLELGLVGKEPAMILIDTNDTTTTILTAGYLTNASKNFNFAFNNKQMALVYATDGISWFEVVVSGTTVSLQATVNPGTVVLPVVDNDFANFSGTTGALKDSGYSPTDAAKTKVVMANAAVIVDHIATYTDTSGTLADDATTAINGGNIAAGLSGTAGILQSYPTTAAKGYLGLAAIDNTGDTAVTISNALHGQATVVSVPDSGQSVTEFILADSSGTQSITSGNLQVDAGNIIAGSDANAGVFESYPGTTNSGTLQVAAVDSSSDVIVTISNADHGQASVVSIPDGGQAAEEFIISDSSTTQNITSGALTVDAGVISSGLTGGGFAGKFTAWATTATNGSISLLATDTGGDFDVILTNGVHGQDTTYNIADIGEGTGSILVNTLDAADTNANIVTFDITVGQAALATAGTVTLQASSGTKQYKIRELFLNSGGTNFSGGGGDRLATISDGTSDYSVLPAANLQALTNARWGDTAIAFPASVAINTSTAAGVALTIAYSGGATDYTAGSMVISGVLERVA